MGDGHPSTKYLCKAIHLRWEVQLTNMPQSSITRACINGLIGGFGEGQRGQCPSNLTFRHPTVKEMAVVEIVATLTLACCERKMCLKLSWFIGFTPGYTQAHIQTSTLMQLSCLPLFNTFTEDVISMFS